MKYRWFFFSTSLHNITDVLALALITEETAYPLQENHVPLKLKTPRFPKNQHDLIKTKHLLNCATWNSVFYHIKRANILLWKIKYLPIVVRVSFFRNRFFDVMDSIHFKTTTREDSIYLRGFLLLSREVWESLHLLLLSSPIALSLIRAEERLRYLMNISFRTLVIFRNIALNRTNT